MTKMTLPLLAMISLAVGCMSERQLPTGDDNLVSQDEIEAGSDLSEEPAVSDGYRPLVGQLPVQNGELDGSIGMVSGLAPDGDYDTSGWGEPHYASVYTLGTGENGAAMTIVEIEGGLNHADLQPGAHLEYSVYDTGADHESLFAYVVGCAGPETNTWDFDQVADETTIDVSQHPDDANILILDYEARFTDWETGAPSSVVGTFEIVRTPS